MYSSSCWTFSLFVFCSTGGGGGGDMSLSRSLSLCVRPFFSVSVSVSISLSLSTTFSCSLGGGTPETDPITEKTCCPKNALLVCIPQKAGPPPPRLPAFFMFPFEHARTPLAKKRYQIAIQRLHAHSPARQEQPLAVPQAGAAEVHQRQHTLGGRRQQLPRPPRHTPACAASSKKTQGASCAASTQQLGGRCQGIGRGGWQRERAGGKRGSSGFTYIRESAASVSVAAVLTSSSATNQAVADFCFAKEKPKGRYCKRKPEWKQRTFVGLLQGLFPLSEMGWYRDSNRCGSIGGYHRGPRSEVELETSMEQKNARYHDTPWCTVACTQQSFERLCRWALRRPIRLVGYTSGLAVPLATTGEICCHNCYWLLRRLSLAPEPGVPVCCAAVRAIAGDCGHRSSGDVAGEFRGTLPPYGSSRRS